MNGSESQRHRSQIRIFFDILKAIDGDPEARITHLLHQANLPHERMKDYLDQMSGRGLITLHGGDEKGIAITDRGRRFLIEFRQMERWANAFGINL